MPLNALPAHLRERVLTSDSTPATGPVVYWMRNAMRWTDNPALEVAALVASALEQPLVVVQCLDVEAPHATDRRAVFVLQGMAELLATASDNGVRYLPMINSGRGTANPLAALAECAGLVVTEEVPLDWERNQVAEVRSRLPCWTVDASCLVPMPLVGKAHTDRAFEFRRATKALRARYDAGWQQTPCTASPWLECPLNAQAVRTEDLNDPGALIAQLPLDHSVPPAALRGGSAAGMERWQAFCEDGLKRYADDRNDPLLDGVSRLSPWLHFGMVSPFRISAEARAIGGRGAYKFLDELLIWRDLSWAWCFHREPCETFEALPKWAQETLEAHANDPRPATFTLEELSRGNTNSPLWNVAQSSLRIDGELHNNVRMSWGKAILDWKADPRAALSSLFWLNDHYALDGRDPNSVAGLLWCLGALDRPFKPEQPITGTVRGRSLDRHAKRLDPVMWDQQLRSRRSARLRVAIVGAGLAGLLCGRLLADQGHAVTLFDKGRRPGGRCATRESRSGSRHEYSLRAFNVADARLDLLTESWCQAGLLAPIDGGYAIVGPSHSLPAHLARDLDVRCSALVTEVNESGQGWMPMLDSTGVAAAEAWDAVILNMPPAQASALLPELEPVLTRVRMAPRWVFYGSSNVPLPANIEGVEHIWQDANGAVALTATEAFSLAQLEHEPEQALSAFRAILPTDLPDLPLTAHRWRYAHCTAPLGLEAWFDAKRGIGLCGDWCPGGGVEGALLSGMAMAGEIGRWVRPVAARSLGTAR